MSDPTDIERTLIFIKPRHSAFQQRDRKPPLLTALLSILAFVALLHLLAVRHLSQINAAMQTCPGIIRHTDYTQIVPFQPITQNLLPVELTEQLTPGTPSVLVQVRNKDAPHLLDVYVYGCTASQALLPGFSLPALSLLFKQQSLSEGSASVSPEHTLLISQLDTSLSEDAQILAQPLQQDVNSEYRWRDNAFTQILFPGLYPVISRVEAQELQEEADNGHALTWSNPLETARMLARDIFQWPDKAIQANLQENNTTEAHVLLTLNGSHEAVHVRLNRLIEQSDRGLWFVTHAQSGEIAIETPLPGLSTSSPLVLAGRTGERGKEVQISLFGHMLTRLPTLNAQRIPVQVDGTFKGSLIFSNPASTQPGLLLVQQLSHGPKEPHLLQLQLSPVLFT